jgi:hypothetical protein
MYKLNLANTLKSAEKKSMFLSVGENETLRLRFAPPVMDNGSLFLLTTTHFRLQEGDKGVAYGCLRTHADQPCPLCDVAYFMMDNGDAAEKKVGREIRPSNNWYAQVWRADKQDDGSLTYSGPYLMRFSKTGTDAINDILRNQQRGGMPFICDVEKGQDILFSRTGTGFDTKYSALATGEVADLNSIIPGWEDKLIKDIPGTVDTRIKTPEEMVQAAVDAHPQIVWDEVLKSAGLV